MTKILNNHHQHLTTNIIDLIKIIIYHQNLINITSSLISDVMSDKKVTRLKELNLQTLNY